MPFNNGQNRVSDTKPIIKDSIREKNSVEYTVLFEWNPVCEPCPFSKVKTSGPYKGKERVTHQSGLVWRADHVSAKTVQSAIEGGVEILSVRTERAVLISRNFFNICPAVMKEVKGSASWQREGNDYKCVGVYQDTDGNTIKEVEFIINPTKTKKRNVAQIRVCVVKDGLDDLNMFDFSNDIRENFMFWVRYGTKGKDGTPVDRHVSNGFTNDADLKFMPVR